MIWIDWLIVLVPTLVIAGFAIVLQRYVRSVADFMAASRVAGRYLITNAGAEMGLSAVGAVAMFELVQRAGFTLEWWNKLAIPTTLMLMLWGFVIYRYRETRVMTLAQFFEIRYNKGFRIFAGFLGFLSGVINYGIFPALAGRFFIYYCGLPVTLTLYSLTLPTLAVVMAVYLTAALALTMSGGHLTIMVTDCVGSLVTIVFYTVVVIVLLWMFKWSQIYEALASAPDGRSLLDPFDTGRISDFNIWFALIGIFGSVYGYMAWQGGHAFNSCAINAHEAKMAGILSQWRLQGSRLMYILIPICAYTFLHHADFAAGAACVQDILKMVPEEQIRTQVTTAVTLGQMLPTGIKGMVVTIFLLGLIAGDSSYLHSWGSIFIQDVVLPFRRKPFTPRQHLFFLRAAILAVALFGFTFSLLYRQTEYVWMFFSITGAIYIGGAGSVLLGGLYWKKGTTAAAWVAMIAGSSIAVGGIILGQFPFVTVPMKIKAPVATTVKVNGKLAQQVGDRWEFIYPLERKGEWQLANVMVENGRGTTTNSIYYAFGVTTPEKLPPETAGASIQVVPSSLTVMPMPEGFSSHLFITLRSINGRVMYFLAMLSAVVLYVVVSLLTCKEDFNMDRMLHRGQYAMETKNGIMVVLVQRRSWIAELIGIDEHFTRGDRILAWSITLWSMFLFTLFVVISCWNLVSRWPVKWWGIYWHYEMIILPLLVMVVTTVWFWLGGVRDLIHLFRRLRTVKRNSHDDGMVVNHRNLDEVDDA